MGVTNFLKASLVTWTWSQVFPEPLPRMSVEETDTTMQRKMWYWKMQQNRKRSEDGCHKFMSKGLDVKTIRFPKGPNNDAADDTGRKVITEGQLILFCVFDDSRRSCCHCLPRLGRFCFSIVWFYCNAAMYSFFCCPEQNVTKVKRKYSCKKAKRKGQNLTHQNSAQFFSEYKLHVIKFGCVQSLTLLKRNWILNIGVVCGTFFPFKKDTVVSDWRTKQNATTKSFFSFRSLRFQGPKRLLCLIKGKITNLSYLMGSSCTRAVSLSPF